MTQSDSLKQIIICGLILVSFGFGAFFLNNYLFNDKEDIEDNYQIKDKYEYNEFQYISVSDEMLTKRYFVDFKNKMLDNTEDAYKLLDRDTKEKYPTYNDFKNYVNLNIEELNASYVNKYTIKKNDNSTDYVIIDQFNNMYTFNSKAVLVYSVNLELYSENSSIFE